MIVTPHSSHVPDPQPAARLEEEVDVNSRLLLTPPTASWPAISTEVADAAMELESTAGLHGGLHQLSGAASVSV